MRKEKLEEIRELNRTTTQIIKFLAIVFLISIGTFTYSLIGFSSYQKENPLWFTVIANSGATIKSVQHKHTSSFETAVWIRVKYDSTQVTKDMQFSNPFVETDFPVGYHAQWSDPSRDMYKDAGYPIPWYFNGTTAFLNLAGIFVLLLFMLLVSLSYRKED